MISLKVNCKKPVTIHVNEVGDQIQVQAEYIDPVKSTQEFKDDQPLVEQLKDDDKTVFLYVFLRNLDRVRNGYFVVGNELMNRLYLRMLAAGYKIPYTGIHGHRIRPDVSVQSGFHKYLRKNKVDIFGKVENDIFLDERGEEFFVKQYKIELLKDFVEYFENVWLVNCSEKYFEKRDPCIISFLRRINQNKTPYELNLSCLISRKCC